MAKSSLVTCPWCGRYLMIGDQDGMCWSHKSNEINPDWMKIYGKTTTQ